MKGNAQTKAATLFLKIMLARVWLCAFNSRFETLLGYKYKRQLNVF